MHFFSKLVKMTPNGPKRSANVASSANQKNEICLGVIKCMKKVILLVILVFVAKDSLVNCGLNRKKGDLNKK